MIEQEFSMIPKDMWLKYNYYKQNKIAIFNKDIRYHLTMINNSIKRAENVDPFIDVVFCQQAINYWLEETDVEMLAKIMNKNGLFIFNTFNSKPSTKPRVLEYKLQNRNYVEISWLIKDTINHIQICQGYEHHFTQFKYMSHKYITDCLKPYFDIKRIKDNKTSIYVCRKR